MAKAELEEAYEEGLRRLAECFGRTPLHPIIVMVVRARVRYWQLRGCGSAIDLDKVDDVVNTKELALQFALFKMGMVGRSWK